MSDPSKIGYLSTFFNRQQSFTSNNCLINLFMPRWSFEKFDNNMRRLFIQPYTVLKSELFALLNDTFIAREFINMSASSDWITLRNMGWCIQIKIVVGLSFTLLVVSRKQMTNSWEWNSCSIYKIKARSILFKNTIFVTFV